MTVWVPPKVLTGTFDLNQLEPVAEYWLYGDNNDPLYGLPYKWNAVITITSVYHSSPNTPTPYLYDGNDVKAGMWLSDTNSSKAVKVTEVISQRYDEVICVIEDVDRYNLFTSDLNQSPSGLGGSGDCILFELGSDGLPNLGNSSNYPGYVVVNPGLVTSLQNRFLDRNYTKDKVRVFQENHTFAVGDVIYFDSDSTYKTLAANADYKSAIDKIVGRVVEINFPRDGYFVYKPRGVLVEEIDPELPGNPGDVIYLDPTLPGKLTAVKPSRFAVAYYVQLDIPTRGILLTGGGGGGSSSSPLGYNASVYKVDNLAARDDIPTDQLQVGDQIYVADTGNGEWAMYMYAGIIGITPTWYKFTDFDSANTDAKTITVDLFYTQNQPLNIYSVGDTARVVDVTVEVLQTFHPTATLTVGDDSDTSRLTDVDDVDLSVLGIYSLSPSYQYGGTGETLVKVYYNQGSSTQGQAKITITYV